VRGVLKGAKEIPADEWKPGPYEREVWLPKAVNAELAKVTYANGVLVVVLPVIQGATRPARLTLDTTSPAHAK
jgi:HSP20 family protein